MQTSTSPREGRELRVTLVNFPIRPPKKRISPVGMDGEGKLLLVHPISPLCVSSYSETQLVYEFVC